MITYETNDKYLMHFNKNHDRFGRFAKSPGGGSKKKSTLGKKMTQQQKDALYEKIRKGDDSQMARRYLRKHYVELSGGIPISRQYDSVHRYKWVGTKHIYDPIEKNRFMKTPDGEAYVRPDHTKRSYPDTMDYAFLGRRESDRWHKNVQWQKAYNSQLNAKNAERGKRYAAHIQTQGLKKIGKATAIGAATLVALGLITHAA